MVRKYLGTTVYGMVVAALFLSCGLNPLENKKNEQTIIPVDGPGVFGITQLKGMNKLTAITPTTLANIVNFDLGSIKGSSAFYFLLYNLGKCKITNVTLSLTDSSLFSVYPAKIDTLIPGSDVGMLPIVKVVAYHGTAIDGPGNRPLMPMGPHSVGLVISGTTKTCRGTDTNVILSAGMNLTALVMDVRLHSKYQEIDFFTPAYWDSYVCFGGGPDAASVGNYYLNDNFNDTLVELVNTGNVPIHLNVSRSFTTSASVFIDSFVTDINAGDSVAIPYRKDSACVYVNFFIIDGNHTIFDWDKFPMTVVGKTYFVIYKWAQFGKWGLTRVPLVSPQVAIFPDSLDTGCVSSDMPILSGTSDVQVSHDTIYSSQGLQDIGTISQNVGTDNTEVPCDSIGAIFRGIAAFQWPGFGSAYTQAPIILNHVYAVILDPSTSYIIIPVGKSISGTDRLQLFWGKFIH